jgi:hypothetical protein
MRRALIVLPLITLNLWLTARADAGGASAGAVKVAGTNSHRDAASVGLVGLLQNGRERKGPRFSATQLRALEINVKWGILIGTHTQRLQLVAPDGAVYQAFTTAIDNANGPTLVQTRVPVAGTWITEYALEGTWQVRVYLEGSAVLQGYATFALTR